MVGEKTRRKNMNGIEYNKIIKVNYEKIGGIDLLTKYVMSEILAPIEDFENAINIIRDNYYLYTSGQLLIIGSYLSIKWTVSRNELLEILNLMYDYLPKREKAIVNYLNALKIYTNNKNYAKSEQYRHELTKSIQLNTPFVFNRCELAEIVNRNEAQKYYKDALNYVEVVSSEQDIHEMSFEHFLDPQLFINEHILGTHLSYVNYEVIKDKVTK